MGASSPPAQAKRALAASLVFPNRELDTLRAIDKWRVEVASFFDLMAVDYFMITSVCIYAICIFFSLGIDDCDLPLSVRVRDPSPSVRYDSWGVWFVVVIMHYVDAIFLCLFACEIFLRVFAFGSRFFRHWHTTVDASIVLLSLAITIVQLADASSMAVLLQLSRLLRVLVIFFKLSSVRAGLFRLKTRGFSTGVESPVFTVLQILQNLRDRSNVETDRDHLDWIASLIGSDRLYTAVVSEAGGKKLDSETAAWLSSQYMNRKSDSAKGRLVQRTSQGADETRTLGLTSVHSISTEQERQLESVLAHVDGWGFDIFELNSASGGKPLVPLVMAILRRSALLERFNIHPGQLARALAGIEAGYSPVPYHNRIHAADVTQTLFALLSCESAARHLGDAEMLAAVLAAAVHDYGHPGLNNSFHVNNRLETAILYNDHAVLENMHISRAWAALTQPEANVFARMAVSEVTAVRDAMVAMVLGTDMSCHFEELARFTTKIASRALEPLSAENTRIVLKMALHCSDVSNPAKDGRICVPWAVRVMDEFFMQGDKEKALGLPVSPFMDRESTQVAKCQVGFIHIIVTPLYDAWHAFAQSDSSRAAVDNCRFNAEQWTTIGDARIEQYLASKEATRDDPILVDHGPLSDPLNFFPSVVESEEKFHYDVVVAQRRRNPPFLFHNSGSSRNLQSAEQQEAQVLRASSTLSAPRTSTIKSRLPSAVIDLANFMSTHRPARKSSQSQSQSQPRSARISSTPSSVPPGDGLGGSAHPSTADADQSISGCSGSGRLARATQ